MDTVEVNTFIKSFYGEDLGYNSNDEEYEYYCLKSTTKLNTAANNSAEQLLFSGIIKIFSFILSLALFYCFKKIIY